MSKRHRPGRHPKDRPNYETDKNGIGVRRDLAVIRRQEGKLTGKLPPDAWHSIQGHEKVKGFSFSPSRPPTKGAFGMTKAKMRKAILLARGSIVGTLVQHTRQHQARPRPSYIDVGRAVEARLHAGAKAKREQEAAA